MPVDISPVNDPLFRNFSLVDRAFPSDSEFLFTQDASYVLEEDSNATIIVPFKIVAPDRDEALNYKDYKVWFEAERPFDIENNNSWTNVEEISLQFVKPAEFKVTAINEADGAIDALDIIYSGFGYPPRIHHALLNDSNGSGTGATIEIDPINGEYRGMLLDSNNFELVSMGSGYQVGNVLTTYSPEGTGFERLYESEVNAGFHPSLSEGTIKIKYLVKIFLLP